MKTINNFVAQFDSEENETGVQKAELQIITFKSFGGIKLTRKGYSILCLDASKTNKREILVFEPKFYLGKKWLVSGSLISNYGCTCFYSPNISQAIKSIKKIIGNHEKTK